MYKILIAEDDIELRGLFQNVLVRQGFYVKCVSNGKEALDHLESNFFDLVISDIMMPVMDGYQALVGIRNLERERNIPEEKAAKVIMATALNDEKNVKMAFELGCTIYSGKPIDQERFEEALKRLDLV